MMGTPQPKPARPYALVKRERAAAREHWDRVQSVLARLRSEGRCEMRVIGQGRCRRRDVLTHHVLGGWGVRGRGRSALAENKLRLCTRCHANLHARILVRSDTAPNLYRRLR